MEHEAHKFNAVHRKRLDSAERQLLLTPRETLGKLGYKEGQSFADIGCGTGLFTIPAAEIGGISAHIYAIDTSEEVLQEVRKKSLENGLEMIETVRSEEYDFKLCEQSADFVLLCAVLHEIDDQPRFLKEAFRICKKSGKIAVIEFNEADIGFGPPPGMRIAAGQVKELLKGAGYVNPEEMTVGAANYAVTAVRS